MAKPSLAARLLAYARTGHPVDPLTIAVETAAGVLDRPCIALPNGVALDVDLVRRAMPADSTPLEIGIAMGVALALTLEARDG